MHTAIAFSALPLFTGALLSDWAYATTHQIQWANFSSWLIAAALVLMGVALAWGVVDVLRSRAHRHRRGLVYVLLLLATWALGFINALVHAKDAWAAMPTGLFLSAAVLILAVAAVAVGRWPGARRAA